MTASEIEAAVRGLAVAEKTNLGIEVAAGEWVAVMGDRAVPGLHGSLCGYAAALARRTGALLLPVAMTRLPGGRHALWCDAPIAGTNAAEGGVRAALRRHLERAPGQWFAFDPLPEGLA